MATCSLNLISLDFTPALIAPTTVKVEYREQSGDPDTWTLVSNAAPVNGLGLFNPAVNVNIESGVAHIFRFSTGCSEYEEVITCTNPTTTTTTSSSTTTTTTEPDLALEDVVVKNMIDTEVTIDDEADITGISRQIAGASEYNWTDVNKTSADYFLKWSVGGPYVIRFKNSSDTVVDTLNATSSPYQFTVPISAVIMEITNS